MHQFDPQKLQNYLAERVDGFTTLDHISQFSDGQSNPTYRVKSGEMTFVLRAKPLGKLLKSAHAVDREYRVMKALSATKVPVPKVLHLSDDASPLGAQFLVMEWVDGRIFWDPALPDLSPKARAEVYDQMNYVLAELHAIDPGAVGLEDYGKPGNYFARQLARWSEAYRMTAAKPLPDALWVIDWLTERMVSDDGQTSLVHGDYRIDNMIFAHDRASVIALLDWELSTLGHPFADLAYQCMHWRLPHAGPFRGLGGLDRQALGLPSETEYVAAYCKRRGIAMPKDWPFYVVFAYFRMFAILQGVLRRARDGNASNPHDETSMRETIDLLARDARQLAAQSA